VFSILEDSASLNDKSVLTNKINMMEFFIKQIGNFIMRHCFDNKPKIMNNEKDSFQILPNAVKFKSYYLAQENSEETKRSRQKAALENKNISLTVPNYIFKPIQRKKEEDHLVFLWLKRLSGKLIDNEQFFKQSVKKSKNVQNHNEQNYSSDEDQPDESEDKQTEFRRQNLKSKLIENRNQKLYPLATTEFLYSPHFNSKLLEKFNPLIFFNLNTDLHYQFKQKSFLLGDEIKGLNLELKKINNFYNKNFSTILKKSSIRFINKDSELVKNFLTMKITPTNLAKLYYESINKFKQTISSIISGRNECFFEPNILIILNHILSQKSKRQFARLDEQFHKNKKINKEDMEKKPKYFVKSLTIPSPKEDQNFGIFTPQIHKILKDSKECEKNLLENISDQEFKQLQPFPNYCFKPKPEFQMNPQMCDFSSMNQHLLSSMMNERIPQQLMGSSFMNQIPRTQYSITRKIEYNNFFKNLLNSIHNDNKKIILSNKLLDYLKLISQGYQIKSLFRNSPIYDFKELKKIMKNLNQQDHNTFELEQAQLLLDKSQKTYNIIRQKNEKLVDDLQDKLSSEKFKLDNFENIIQELTSDQKLAEYKEIMRDSLNTFFIGNFN
jgi:hypothetical protein